MEEDLLPLLRDNLLARSLDMAVAPQVITATEAHHCWTLGDRDGAALIARDVLPAELIWQKRI